MANTAKRKSSRSKAPPNEAFGMLGDIKAFWDSQAKEHGGSDLATNPDTHYRSLEIESIVRAISAMKHDTILDVGCGNGFTTKAIAKAFPVADITGVDFSHAMLEEAIENNSAPNIGYVIGNVIGLSREEGLDVGGYDVVLSSRCLINLANWEEQKVGILEMRKMLVPDGRLILIENVQEGLDNLNDLRGKLGLSKINPPWHNKYLPLDETRKFLDGIKGHILTTEYVENIGNFYYLASRVLYAKLCKDQGIEPDYNNPINAIASQMPTMGEYYACSPNYMFILKNEAGIEWGNKKPNS